jgi:hypothetical protein
MVAAIVITYIAAFTAVVLRIISRRLVRVRLGFDDYTAIAALVSSTFSSTSTFLMTSSDMCNRLVPPAAHW